jgi:hypothetical protein
VDYQKVYDQIIQKAKAENRQKGGLVYYEAHHIIPKCMGGTGFSYQWKTHPNIVLLTAKEHFLCHRILARLHPTNFKLCLAFWMMCSMKKNTSQQRLYNVTNNAYQEAKELHRIVMQQPKTQEWKDNHSKIMTGKRYSDDINKKKSRPKELNGFFGKTHTTETKQKNREWHLNKVVSAETKIKLSKSGLLRPKIKCNICKREIGGGMGNFKKHKCIK